MGPERSEMEDEVKVAREGIAIVADIIKAAGDNPQVKEAGANLGQTALTLTKAINNVLLPLAAVNFAFEKARTYFKKKFESDISAKTAAIPAECIVEPKASIAGPVLQGLAFSHEEPNLKDMYLSLLATAMDSRSASDAHPAYVEIIKQLSSEEARLLPALLRLRSMPIAQIKKTETDKPGWLLLQTHVTNLRDLASNLPVEDPRQTAMVDNWIRLGLVRVQYTEWLAVEDAYGWVEERPEYQRIKQQYERDGVVKIMFDKGMLSRTAFGDQFAHATGLLDLVPKS